MKRLFHTISPTALLPVFLVLVSLFSVSGCATGGGGVHVHVSVWKSNAGSENSVSAETDAETDAEVPLFGNSRKKFPGRIRENN